MGKTSRRGSGGSSTGQPPKDRAQGGRTTTSTVKTAPATPGGPNRQVRKEEARKQREAIQRKMSRRSWLRWVGVAAVVALIGVAVAGVVVYQAGATSRAIKAAGCGTVQTVPKYKTNPALDRTHIAPQGSPVTTPPPLSSYSSTPPASGPHMPTPLNAGVYPTPPDVYATIHSLEHAAVIVWYRPGATGGELSKIQNTYRNLPSGDHVIVAPYNYPTAGAAGRLPAGKQMVLVAWHRMQACGQVSMAAAQDFVAHYRVTTGSTPTSAYKGEAPEAGSRLGI
jgi:hypothetical protein